jgi:hypothetical protein
MTTTIADVLKAAIRLALLRAGPAPRYTAVKAALRDLETAACRLDLEGACVLNAQLVEHTMYKMGVRDDPPHDLSKGNLIEMVAAGVIVRAIDDAAPPGSGRTIHTVMDDRAVAAIYTTYNYDASPQHDVEPVTLIPGKACAVLAVKETTR